MGLFLLDYFFLIFHTTLIFFNLFGWIFKSTRRLNLATLVATAFSWVVLGYRYGFGYCVCTDWHWMVLKARGAEPLPRSYITYLFQRIAGITPNPDMIDVLTGTSFTLALICSLWVNLSSDFNRRGTPLELFGSEQD